MSKNHSKLNLPVLIITYSRVDGVKNLLDACISAGVEKIYVAIDGPKDENTRELQKRIREILAGVVNSRGVEVIVWQREANLGVSVSVITAIDWFFKHEVSGAILEDDLLVSSDFLSFAESALVFFESKKEIQLISGNRYDRNSFSQAVVVSYPQTWGWATWREKWLELRRELDKKPKIKLHTYNKVISNFWEAGAKQVWDGYIDTWDLLIANSLLANGKFCLLPPVNLVSNFGNDEFSTHTSMDTFPIRFPIESIEKFNLNLDKISLAPDQQSDRFLETKVFGIRNRHRFLKFYKPVINLFLVRKFQKASLGVRLNQVLIP